MAGNPRKNNSDLFNNATGGFESNDALDFNQVCLPAAVRNNVVADFEQLDAVIAHHQNEIFAGYGYHGHEPRPPRDTALQRNAYQIDSPPWNPIAYWVEPAQANLNHSYHPAVSQAGSSMSRESLALDSFGNASGGRCDFRDSAHHAGPRAMLLREGDLIDTGTMSSHSPGVSSLSRQEQEAGAMFMQAQHSQLTSIAQHQMNQANASVVSHPTFQQRRLMPANRTVPRASASNPTTYTVQHQIETLHNAMVDGTSAVMNTHIVPGDGSYGPGNEPVRSDLGLPTGQLRTALLEPPACSFPGCDYQFRNKSALKKHVKTHNPVNKRHKCDHCTYASRYPKDILRHSTRRHPEPDAQMQVFVCREPGCEAEYNRRDNLARHCRDKHPDTTSFISTESADTSRFDDEQTSSVGGYIDPRLISSSSASNYHSSSGTDPQYSQ